MRRPAPAARPSRSRPPRPARDRAGFTLIEVAILIVIAGIAVLPLAMLFATTSIRPSDARSAAVAVHLAQTKLEEITARLVKAIG